MITEFDDYREYLKNILQKRCIKNPNYSMRAFARDLELHPARLSDILNKKTGLSLDLAVKIGHILGLTRYDLEYLCDLVTIDSTKSDEVKLVTLRRLQEKKELRASILSEDANLIISEWYHFGILEFTLSAHFQSNVQWLSDKLNIEERLVQDAVDRLFRLGLLMSDENGKWKKIDKFLTTTENVPNEAIQNVNLQLLNKASLALNEQSVLERDFSTITFSIDISKLEEARKIITKCRHELIRLLESGEQTELYCFSAQLFRLAEKSSNI